MTNIFTDLFGISEAELQDYITGGWIRAQDHPDKPLRILNYTEKTTFAKKWDSVTLACRGLIYNTETGELVARPFPKFFNHNEELAPVFGPNESVVVNDKMDGSLGILYSYPRTKWNGGNPITFPEYEIATRGSFRSEQAVEATEMLEELYPEFEPFLGYTYLFEIIYPENRIVCNYGDRRELVLLGAVRMTTGNVMSPGYVKLAHDWPGPIAQEFHKAETFLDALKMPPREGAEGIVVRGSRGRMVKIKQESYVKLHRLVTGLTERTVWEYLSSSNNLEEMLEPLPEEFHPWVRAVAERLNSETQDRLDEARSEYRYILSQLAAGFSRGEFARLASKSSQRSALFFLLDEDEGRARDLIWKGLKPPCTPIHHQS